MNLEEAYQVAVQRWKERNFPEAEQICRQILQEAPSDAGTWHLLGVVLTGLNQCDAAIRIFRQLLAAKPDDLDMLVNLGAALAKQGKLDQALNIFERALRLYPDSSQALWNLNGTLQGKMMARAVARPLRQDRLPYLGDKVVLLHCPRSVREWLRPAGLHGGCQIDPSDGADQWLNILMVSDDEPARRVHRVHKWLEWLRNEAVMSDSTCTVWSEDMTGEFADIIREAAGSDLIEIRGRDGLEIFQQLAARAVPPPPTDGKIFAVVSVRNGGVELLPHWLEHYTKLGADELLVGVFEDVGEPVREELARCAERYKFRIFPQRWGMAVEAEHYSQRQTGCRQAGALPQTWIIHTDLDELHEYPAPLRQIADEAARRGIRAVPGKLVDRVAADGSLPAVMPSPSIWEQFPIECKLTERITRGKPDKIMLARYSVQVSVGHHVAFNEPTVSAIGNPEHYRVAHFKWRGDLVSRLRWAMARPNASPIWKGESQALLDWLDRNGGRIDFNDPELAARRREGSV